MGVNGEDQLRLRFLLEYSAIKCSIGDDGLIWDNFGKIWACFCIVKFSEKLLEHSKNHVLPSKFNCEPVQILCGYNF